MRRWNGTYAPNSYAAIDGFYKHLTNFIVGGVRQVTFPGVIDPFTGQTAVFNINGQVNGPDANVRGLELALQHVFRNTGFGFQANATLVNTNRKFPTDDISGAAFAITGLANSANFVGFYDKHGFQFRVAVNWRDTLSAAARSGSGRHVRRRAGLSSTSRRPGRRLDELRHQPAVHSVRRSDQHHQFQLQHPRPLLRPAAGYLELRSSLHGGCPVPLRGRSAASAAAADLGSAAAASSSARPTQTCADGTVILATATCPAPPPATSTGRSSGARLI